LFAYTCSLSVAALKGRAESVVNVDMSKSALSTGRQNHRLNDIDMSKVKFLSYNILKSWGGIRRAGPYDLIIMDPPEYQKGSFSVKKDYEKLIRRIPELMPEGGVIFSTLNSPYYTSDFLLKLFDEYCPGYRLEGELTSPDCFKDKEPEKGLKVLIINVTGN
jgi:23S rRNA (cytosine1962-C5)-methyltransferase